MKDINRFTIKKDALEITTFIAVDVSLGVIFGIMLANNPNIIFATALAVLLLLNVIALYGTVKSSLKLQNTRGQCQILEELIEVSNGTDKD